MTGAPTFTRDLYARADWLKSLQDAIEQAAKSGFLSLQLEARRALGETEAKAGNSAAAQAQFLSLEGDAKARGFLLIAHKARTAARANQ